jgi:hypothetical protein
MLIYWRVDYSWIRSVYKLMPSKHQLETSNEADVASQVTE